MYKTNMTTILTNHVQNKHDIHIKNHVQHKHEIHIKNHAQHKY